MATSAPRRSDPPANPTAKSGRGRSFGGCATCRTRHMKCDERQPSCTTCESSGLSCGGYEKNIFFILNDETLDAGVVRFRRPLLTEEQRKQMSEWMTTSVPPHHVSRQLSLIDEACDDEGTTDPSDVQISHGPFGAFRLTIEQSNPDLPLEEPFPGQCIPDSEHPFPMDEALTPRLQEFFRTNPLHSEQDTSLPMIDDIWDLHDDSSRIEEVLDEMSIDMPSIDSRIPELASESFTYPSFTCATPVDISIPSEHAPIPHSIQCAVPHDAVYLLKHYSTTVLRLLTPFRHSKTPWHILFIPYAKSCLAALTLGEEIDNASLCAFFGMLAVSAFSLGGITKSSTWLKQGKTYKQFACEQATIVLATAYNIPKAAKYKSILIALLTMIQVSILTGEREQAEYYFLETEKLIRINGLNRRNKSRKVRLLHHCYAFERIIYETTYLGGTPNLHQRNQVRKAIESSEAAACSSDSLCFRLNKWNINLDEEMQKAKGRDQGENDLHLQIPGSWSGTLYPEIFGVPEKYIVLLSLTIRLDKEKEDAEQGTGTSGLAAAEYLSCAKALEQCINKLNQSSEAADWEPQIPAGVLKSMLTAMQQALSIYFYRRIYNIDESMLQTKVATVLECLLQLESAEAGVCYGSARLVWPAFIAACEAESAQVQASFLNWFENTAKDSGLGIFDDLKANLERVWEEKRKSPGISIPWQRIYEQYACT